MAEVKTIGIVIKPNASQGPYLIERLIAWLSDRKKVVRVIHPQAAKRIPSVDMVIVLGGDGTLLSAARALGGRPIPILAVNIGNLGFLTEIALDELYPSLTRVFETTYQTDPRMMLQGVIGRGKKKFKARCVLNDIIVHKGSLVRGVPIEVRINGAEVTTFRGDGLIMASATGSTAYTLSAGGPIVHPSVEAIVLTPIAPHILTNRPIVVPASSKIEVFVKSEGMNPSVAFDGQEVFPLQTNDSVCVQASPHRLNLIRSSNRSYYQVLREKLKWGTGTKSHN